LHCHLCTDWDSYTAHCRHPSGTVVERPFWRNHTELAAYIQDVQNYSLKVEEESAKYWVDDVEPVINGFRAPDYLTLPEAEAWLEAEGGSLVWHPFEPRVGILHHSTDRAALMDIALSLVRQLNLPGCHICLLLKDFDWGEYGDGVFDGYGVCCYLQLTGDRFWELCPDRDHWLLERQRRGPRIRVYT